LLLVPLALAKERKIVERRALTNYVGDIWPEAKREGKAGSSLTPPPCPDSLVRGLWWWMSGVVTREMVGSEEDLEVGDFLLDRGGIGVGSADESWMPYLLCNMDSAAA